VDQAEIAAQVERIGENLRRLRRSAPAAEAGEREIVLHPRVAYSIFSFFVWGNMGGSTVYHGQSAWSREDFAEARQVFRPDLQVSVDPWQPLGPGSFGWTGEGVPSSPETYIDSGRLVKPVADLKYARRLGIAPNTPPGSEHSVQIGGLPEEQAEGLIASLEDGVLVLSVLGLHTQDRTSGNYSLSAPQALLIRGGEAQGRVKATLNGNFFDQLRAGDLRLVRFAGQHSPGLAFRGAVTFERLT
jgi:PmbA protein